VTDDRKGAGIMAVDTIGTVLFAVTAVVETIVLQRWSEVVGISVALVLFALGCLAFLAGYARAIQRSRSDEIAIANLYLLGGSTAPRRVRRRLNLLLAAQIAVAVVTAAVRPFTTLAFGILVPVFGLGLNGLWAARHGQFPPRVVTATAPRRRPAARPRAPVDPTTPDEMEQNADHG
jgi:hypothetical protein